MNNQNHFLISFLFPVFLFGSLNLQSADGGASLAWIIPAVQSFGVAIKQWNQWKAENKKRRIKRPKNAKPYIMSNDWTIEKYRAHLDAGGDPEAYLGISPAQEKEIRKKAIAEHNQQQKDRLDKMKQRVIHTASETIVLVGKIGNSKDTAVTVDTIPFTVPMHRTRDMIEQKFDALLQEDNQAPKIDLTPSNNLTPGDSSGSGGTPDPEDPNKDPKKKIVQGMGMTAAGEAANEAAKALGKKKNEPHAEPHPEVHTQSAHNETHVHTPEVKGVNEYRAHEEKISTELQGKVNEYRETQPFKKTPLAPNPVLHQPPHITKKPLDFEMKQAKHEHVWTDKPAHIKEDTPEARRILNECVHNPDNYIGQDLAGNFVYKGPNPKDGREIYAYVREGKLVDGGSTSKPWTNEMYLGLDKNRPKDRGDSVTYSLVGSIGAGLAGTAATEVMSEVGSPRLSDNVISKIRNSEKPKLVLPDAPQDSVSKISQGPEMKAIIDKQLDLITKTHRTSLPISIKATSKTGQSLPPMLPRSIDKPSVLQPVSRPSSTYSVPNTSSRPPMMPASKPSKSSSWSSSTSVGDSSKGFGGYDFVGNPGGGNNDFD